MAGFNKVILMGNLTADPEFKTTPSGVPVTTFSIAVGRRFVKQGDEVTADFFNVVAWRNQAEFVSKYFSKGRPIIVVGAVQNRSYTTQDGQKRYVTEIIADECHFTPGSNGGANQQNGVYYGAESQQNSVPASQSQAKPAAATFEELSTEDDLPF